MKTAPVPPPACPRCGYDQSGIIATWQDYCPLRGTCSECGHEFEFCRILNSRRYRVPWLFEHAAARPRWDLLVRAPWRTLVRVAVPWRFWRDGDGVRLDTDLSLLRLIAWLPLAMLAPIVLTAMLSAAQIAVPRLLGVGGRAAMTAAEWAGVVINAVLMPLGLGYVDSWLRYCPAWEVPYMVQAWAACAILMPLMILALSSTRLTCRIRTRHVVRAAVYGMGVLAMWPLDALVGLILELVPLPGSGGRSIFAVLFGTYYGFNWSLLPFAFGLLGIAWFAAWWYTVIVRVFRLTHGHAVWALLMVACLLVFFIFASLAQGLNWLLV
jgi:hypothetical protein